MSVEVIGLREVQEQMYQVSNLLKGANPQLQGVVWEMGVEARANIQLMCTQVVYNSPPSPTYQRTGYLREAIYLTTLGKTDRAEVQARAYALAQSTYPSRKSNRTTYAMVPHTPYPSLTSVRVTSGARYSDFVEYGSRSAGPRPFMRAGLDAGRGAVVSVGAHEISRLLSEIQQRRSKIQPRTPNGRFARA